MLRDLLQLFGLLFPVVQQMALMPNDSLSYVSMHVRGAMVEQRRGEGGGVCSVWSVTSVTQHSTLQLCPKTANTHKYKDTWLMDT